MIIGNATVEIKADRLADFEKLFTSTFQHTSKEPGVLEYRFHRSLQNPCKYLIFEKYVDQAAVDSHMNSAPNQQFIHDVDEMLASPCYCEYYEELVNVDSYR